MNVLHGTWSCSLKQINVTNLTISSFVPWFKILSQYGAGIVLLLGFGRVMQYPSKFHGECKYFKMMQVLHLNSITLLFHNICPNSKIYVMELKRFMGYTKRGSACELSNFGH
jgi:hypothetical protein